MRAGGGQVSLLESETFGCVVLVPNVGWALIEIIWRHARQLQDLLVDPNTYALFKLQSTPLTTMAGSQYVFPKLFHGKCTEDICRVSLYLDPQIRDWVLFPITLVMVRPQYTCTCSI